MRLTSLILLAILGTACQSPVGPSGLDDQMRWNEPATNQGCTPRWPLPPAVPSSKWDSANFYDNGNNLTITVIRANDLLFVEFVRTPQGTYQVCYWDTSDN